MSVNKLVVPIVQMDSSILKAVSGASVWVYQNLADGSSPVTSAGVVSGSAVLATLYEDRDATTEITQPLTSDTEGNITAWASNQELHFRVVLPSGLTYGISHYPHIGPSIDYLQTPQTDLTLAADNLNLTDKDGSSNIAIMNAAFTNWYGRFTPESLIVPNTPVVAAVGAMYVDFSGSTKYLKIYDGSSWLRVAIS